MQLRALRSIASPYVWDGSMRKQRSPPTSMRTMYALRQVSLDHGDSMCLYSNSNSGADDIQKSNQKLISHNLEAGKNYSQKEGGTHRGVFLINHHCLSMAYLLPTRSQVDGRVRITGDHKALKSTQLHGSTTSFMSKKTTYGNIFL